MTHAMNSNFSPLLTDLYQLTMACGYWRSGKADQEAVFHLFFRTLPFQGGYAIAAGLADGIEYVQGFHFTDAELVYLASLTGQDGKRLFDGAFLEHLRGRKLRCDIDAVPEGTAVFAHEPLVRVTGPLLEAQLLETALLNTVNFQTLIATKAARVCQAARGEPVIEFGLRRAQGADGGVTASRAAFIGGCAGTSNVLAGMRHGIPVRGTHAHSWVMSFDTEREAFEAYAEALPNNCVFLVDTYDTLGGVREAIRVGRRLRELGHDLAGIRLDSGDLAWLSIEARKMLDAAGFPQAAIVASNDLDEHLIESLHHQGAAINVWGVGTRLVTAYDQPALGGVYKLGAIRGPDGVWQPRLKLSEQVAKATTPGILQVRRFRSSAGFEADAIYDQEAGLRNPPVIVDPRDPTRRRPISSNGWEDLLVPVFRAGGLVYDPPPLPSIQERTKAQLSALDATVKRLQNPHEYPAGLELGLHERKLALMEAARKGRSQGA